MRTRLNFRFSPAFSSCWRILVLICAVAAFPTSLASALTYDEAAQVPLRREEIARRRTVDGPGPGDWARAGDSWVAAEGASTPTHGGKLEVVDFYFSAGAEQKEENRVFASLARPVDAPGKLPVLMVFHGGGGHGDHFLATAVARAYPGFAVLAMDYNGQFRPGAKHVTHWAGVDDPQEILKGRFQPKRQLIPVAAIAARRALDLLAEDPGFDLERVALLGISYGGWVAFHTAATDPRVDAVVAKVSSGGVAGTASVTARPERTLSATDAELWRQRIEPMALVKKIRCPVFLALGTNDHFFSLDGARGFRDALTHPGTRWLLRPNSDHNAGGPQLPDPTAAWLHAALAGESARFPRVLGLTAEGDHITWRTSFAAASCTLWWSPGSAPAPARYWKPLVVPVGKPDAWSVTLPSTWQGVKAQIFVTAQGVDEMAVSSEILEVGDAIGAAESLAALWRDGVLRDIEEGADAWRVPLFSPPTSITNAASGGVRIAGAKGFRALTNSIFTTTNAAEGTHGLRIQLSGTPGAELTLALLRQGGTLDEERFSSILTIPENGAVEVPWSQFQKTSSGNIWPFDTIELSSAETSGITVGAIHFLTQTTTANNNMKIRNLVKVIPTALAITHAAAAENIVLNTMNEDLSIMEMRSEHVDEGRVIQYPGKAKTDLYFIGRVHTGAFVRLLLGFKLPPGLRPEQVQNAELSFYNGSTKGNATRLLVLADPERHSLDWSEEDFRSPAFRDIGAEITTPLRARADLDVTEAVREALASKHENKVIAFRLQVADDGQLQVIEEGKSAEHTQVGGPDNEVAQPTLTIIKK